MSTSAVYRRRPVTFHLRDRAAARLHPLLSGFVPGEGLKCTIEMAERQKTVTRS